MKKMKTLFIRDYFDNHKFTLTDKVAEGYELVLAGEGKATRKYDGTCCLIKNNQIYRRFDWKKGRNLPKNAIPCQEKADEVTGSFPHWVLCEESNPNDKWYIKAFNVKKSWLDGTYELCGEHFQNNIDKTVQTGDILIRHGEDILDVPRDFSGIRAYLNDHQIEGIVFHRENGDMCKIKRSDFGFTLGRKR